MKRVWLIGLGDFIAFWLSLLIILSVRLGGVFNSPLASKHILPFAILYISWVLIFYLFSLYDLFVIKPNIPHLRRFALALMTSLFVGVILFYLVPIFGITPKTNLLLQVVSFGVLSFLSRRMFYVIYSKRITRPAILVGERVHMDELHNAIKNNPQIGLSVVFYSQNLSESLKNYSGQKNSVFIIDTDANNISTQDFIRLYKNDNEIIDIAEAYERYLDKIPIGSVSQSWILENIKIKKDALYSFSSRIIEVVFSIIALIVSSPVVAVCALLIHLEDKGPVFFKQDRIGINGKVFKLFKLRSMKVHEEKKGEVWLSDSGPLVTRIGKIIRKTHIDEIPQMINILRGDLALVGPRPEWTELVDIFEKSIPNYGLRHIIRPGFTGWAQIKYRYSGNIETTKEKFEYDLYYIKNRNIFIDFGIVIKTIQIIFTH